MPALVQEALVAASVLTSEIVWTIRSVFVFPSSALIVLYTVEFPGQWILLMPVSESNAPVNLVATSRNVISFKLLQPAKAPVEISSTNLGITTLGRREQPMKAFAPIRKVLLERVRFSSAVQFLKARAPIVAFLSTSPFALM
nr:hypothetical protein [uncultured Oscillibacter sp.]